MKVLVHSNQHTGYLRREWEENGFFSHILPFLLALVCLAAALCLDLNEQVSNTGITILGMSLIAAIAAVYAASGGKFTEKEILLLLFAVGFLLRLNYIMYTELTMTQAVRQHDVSTFTEEAGYHSNYIMWCYNHPFAVPADPTRGQYYHPPLHYWIASLWMHFLTALGYSLERAVASLQFLSLFYSSCCMIVFERILSALKVRGGGKITAFAILAFHPTFLLLAGSVNNDILAILFTLLAMYFTIRWYQEPTARRILSIAVFIGLAMMTKLTAVLAAPPIAAVFLVRFLRDKERRKRYIGQFAAFGSVSFPLGLWYPMWKYITYGVAFDYVPNAGTGSDQYVGNYTIWQRFFDFSDHPFRNVYENRTEFHEYNPFVGIIKTSLFGEWTLADDGTTITQLARILLVVNIILIALSIAAMIYCALHRTAGMDGTMKLFLIIYQVFSLAYFLYFCFDFPHTCSMDFRYIAPCCLIGALFIGAAMNRLEEAVKPVRADAESGSAEQTQGNRCGRMAGGIIRGMVTFCVVIFCSMSAGIYILLGI